jgi:hypothetical protein
MSLPPVQTWRLQRPRAGKFFHGLDEDLERYAFQSLRYLIRVLGSIRGLRIVEIGPGDALTSGLSLLAAGATSYTAVDRFPGPYSGSTAKSWYRGIKEVWPRFFPEFAWPADLDPAVFPESYPERVRTIARPVEDIKSQRHADVVCSFQVGEHVTDINAFAHVNTELLVSGGTAIHRVDFGPHDCWLEYKDPMIFLRFPNLLWRMMGSNRATPNRFRHHELYEAFVKAGLIIQQVDVNEFPRENIQFERLHKRFQSMPIDSLMVQDAVYVIRRSIK